MLRAIAKLKKLESEELARLQELRQDGTGKNAAFGDAQLIGLSEQELDAQCDELFAGRPVEFIPRKGSVIDEEIALLIHDQNIRIPILHIKDSLYLIGHKRLTASIRRDDVVLRVGGGYEKFSEHIPHNARYYERALAVHMLKSGESLETVVDLLYNGKKVPNLIQEEI